MNIVVGNYNIDYIDEGEGELVLLLHGWGANKECFSGLIPLLKNKYRVLAIDLPGFGKSSQLKKSFCVDDYVDIVIAFVNEIINNSQNLIKDKDGRVRIILIGHSYGGRIIIKLNSRDNLPFIISKNVLIDAAGLKDKRNITTLCKIYLFKALKNIVKILPLDVTYKKNLEIKLKSKFGSSDYNNAKEELRETLVRSVNEDLTEYLTNMKETLLIWGENDIATPLYMAKIMEKNIKNAGLVVLKNAGHFSFLDDYGTFMNVMASYFNI